MSSRPVVGEGAVGPTPAVSVVIPCYNLGSYVNEAVQSVLDQTYQDFEILIVDDGSTDPATRHLFTSYQRPKTRVIRTENRGLAEARNLGLRESSGRYLSFLDADDVYEPTFLERTVAVLDSDASVAFASCWLTAFGRASFLWSPTTCDFPHLLAEDTVCTPALTRKKALLEVGGFDPGMPVPGYEDWDLAIGLVERGLVGRIVPESLFRYRIRGDSMSGSCTSPENHARLFRYIVRKHPESYRKHLGGVLGVIETRTKEIEEHRPVPPPASRPDLESRASFLGASLRAVLESHSWRLARPLRRAADRLRAPEKRRSLDRSPRISVVVTCWNQAEGLTAAVESVSRQTVPGDEIILVDDGSSDPVTLHVLDGFRSAGFPVLVNAGNGLAAAREAGLRLARAPYVFALGADQAVAPDCLPRSLAALESDAGLSYVLGGLRDADGSGFTWLPARADLESLLSCPRLAFPVVRREAYRAARGYDAALPTAEAADCDLLFRLAAGGCRGSVLPDAIVEFHVWRRPKVGGGEPYPALVGSLFEKHRSLFERHALEVVSEREDQRRRLQACAWDPFNVLPEEEHRGEVRWGDLRRLEPVSRVWGLDRGEPVDRYYIGRFLDRCRRDIRGRVLEVKDANYTIAYGDGVEKSDIVDIAPDNPSATVVADLAAQDSLPRETWDCFVLTQTIHIIYETRRVLENAFRALKPGGVLLATLPCVSRVDYESGLDGDFWRFTPASARRLFEEAFGPGNVEVEAAGNVLASCSFLMGLAAGELTNEELDHPDSSFPLILCVRAVKRDTAITAQEKGDSRKAENVKTPRALILLYHRVDRSRRDRWDLCVSPLNFEEQMARLAGGFEPLRLTELMDRLRRDDGPSRGVVVTFDDGYRDNLTVALPLLRRFGIPATFFVSGDGAASGETFWWERLDASVEAMGLEEEEARRLHASLMTAALTDRERVLRDLPAGQGPFPERMSRTDLEELARDPSAEIGAHGWSHRALAGLPADELRHEIEDNVRTLGEIRGSPVESFAYPFGGPFTGDTVEALRRAGIRNACRLGSEAVTSATERTAMPRLEVRDWSGEEFETRLRALLDS